MHPEGSAQKNNNNNAPSSMLLLLLMLLAHPAFLTTCRTDTLQVEA